MISQLLSTHPFNILYDEMGSLQKAILLHIKYGCLEERTSMIILVAKRTSHLFVLI